MTVLKRADDKQPQIDALAALRDRPDVDARTRKLIEDEIWSIRLGKRGEDEAAYNIDFAYADRDNHVVIHDLRLEVGSRVAQIDHLILNRVLDLWVCETKAFSEGVKIDEQGYWRRYAGARTYGMPSPVLQNENHVQVLRDLFDSGTINLPRRIVKLKPTYVPVVLLSNAAKLDLPRSRAARSAIRGLETVIKSQELRQRIRESLDDDVKAIRALPKLVGSATIHEIGRQLVAAHRPALLIGPERFGLPKTPVATMPRAVRAPARPTTSLSDACASCGASVTEKVARYTLDNSGRFGGEVLCWNCQRSPKRARA